MTKEIPLQYDFAGDLVDTRTRKQKRLARQREGWQQAEMFKQREVAQWGVRLHPMNLVTRNGNPLGMTLQIEDPRSEEQREADRQYEAESRTYRMFRERPELYTVDGPSESG